MPHSLVVMAVARSGASMFSSFGRVVESGILMGLVGASHGLNFITKSLVFMIGTSLQGLQMIGLGILIKNGQLGVLVTKWSFRDATYKIPYYKF